MKGCVWICAVGKSIMWAKHVGEVWQWSGGTSAFLAVRIGVCLATIGNLEQRMLETLKVDLQKWGIYIRQCGM